MSDGVLLDFSSKESGGHLSTLLRVKRARKRCGTPSC